MNSKEVNPGIAGLLRRRVLNLLFSEMVLPVLIVDLEMSGGSHLAHPPFGFTQSVEFLKPVRTANIGAFVDGNDESPFPLVESLEAVRTVVFAFSLTQPFMHLECSPTDFAFQLASLFTIIEVDIVVRGVTVRTPNPRWHLGLFRSTINRLKGFVMLRLIFRQDYPVVFFLSNRFFLTGTSESDNGESLSGLKSR